MESDVLELQRLPETDERDLLPKMCCDTGHCSYLGAELASYHTFDCFSIAE